MIYCISKKDIPTKVLEKQNFQDLSGSNWIIHRTENNLYLELNKESKIESFRVVVNRKRCYNILNRNCFKFNKASFDIYCDIRDLIHNSSTTGMFEAIKEFLSIRFTKEENVFNELN